VHGVAARSKFPSQNAFKNTILGALLEVKVLKLLKKITPLHCGRPQGKKK